MDFPVQATIYLGCFQDKGEALKILRSHEFVIEDRGTVEVRVKGLFLGLKCAKADLEQLLEAQRQTDAYSSSPCASPSGAIPKTHYRNNAPASGGNGSRSGSRNKPLRAAVSSPSSSAAPASDTSQYHLNSPQHRAPHPPSPDRRASGRHRHETLAVEGDVFQYAQQVRHEDLEGILGRHGVGFSATQVGESFHITLDGGGAKMAAGELQRFLSELHTSLRTQEVIRKDVGPQGELVLRRIRENGNVHRFVLVCEMSDRLHLIGPSAESYDLKQMLLEKSADRAGRTGRMFDRGSRRRSSSLPAPSQKNRGGGGGAVPQPPAGRGAHHSASEGVGAAGDSPSKHEGGKREGAEPSRRRSQSMSADNKAARSRKGNPQETESRPQFFRHMPNWVKGLFKRKK